MSDGHDHNTLQAELADSPRQPTQPASPASQRLDSLTQPRSFQIAALLFVLTFASMTYMGTIGAKSVAEALWYSVPLMAILLSHELGHYIAARLHGVRASPPFFIPVPKISPLGTMGAVILMPDRIARRDALLDIGAAGPLAGLVVALPVLAYGIAHSPVLPQSTDGGLMEGRSLLYLGLLYLLKGPIPAGQDIMLSPTAFAGWAGLLVTMINLIPVGQLDGGHVAYALFGERQERFSRRLRWLLLPLAVVVSLSYGIPALLSGLHGEALQSQFAPGLSWLMWWAVLRLMMSRQTREHPPTDDDVLSPKRRMVAMFTLALFVLLFMPAWMREIPPITN